MEQKRKKTYQTKNEQIEMEKQTINSQSRQKDKPREAPGMK